MSNTIPILQFLFKNEWPVLSSSLKTNPIYEVEEFSTANDLATYLSGLDAALIISSLMNKEDLINIATFVKLQKKIAKDAISKIVVINFSGDKQLEKALAKLGIQDVIDPTITTKPLRYKVDFWMKSLTAQAKKAQSSASKSLKSADSKTPEAKTSDASIKWEAPLECVDDVWIIKNDSDCKRILSKWLIKVMGPSPYTGQWVESPGKRDLWRFEFNSDFKDLLILEEGDWFFFGNQKPDFVWKENIWLIAGSEFDLFYKNGNEIFSRLRLKDKVLTVCKNSDYAKTKEPTIIESFDKELVFKKESDNLDNLEGETEGGVDRLNNLQGKGKTDQLNSGHLSGKSNGENSDNKGPYSSPHSGNVREGQELDLENKKNAHEKFYKGHNEAEKYDAADLNHEKSEVEKINTYYNHTDKSQRQEREKENDLSGKSSTDKVPSHYGAAQKNTPEGANADKKSRERSLEEEGKDSSGKSSTDKIPSHYGAAQKNTPEGVSADKKSRERSLEEEGKDPSGKSSTDKIPSHYGAAQKNTPEGVSADKKSRERSLEEEGKDPSGKSSTEKIPSHYGAAQKNTPEGASADKNSRERSLEEAGKDLKGKSSTDKVPSHYGAAEKDTPFESNSTKTPLERAGTRPEAGLSGKTSTDKIHETLNGKTSIDHTAPHERGGEGKANNVLPLVKKASANSLVDELRDPELAEACETAKVTSTISFESQVIPCELDDYFDQTIIFLAEQEGLRNESTVDIDLSFNYQKKDTKLEFKGLVTSIDSDDEGKSYITIEISQENGKSFETFMKLYRARQKSIELFLKRASGL